MFLSVNELMGLPGLPGTAQGIRACLNKRAGESPDLKQKREGSKAFVYHIDCLPEDTQAAVRERQFNALLNDAEKAVKPTNNRLSTKVVKTKQELELMRQCPALLEKNTAELTEKQRSAADARAALVAEVLKLEDAGLSRIKAITFVCDQSRNGNLPARLQLAAEKANARKGNRTGISTRTLNTWVVDYLRANDSAERLALLAPGHHKSRTPEQIGWLPQFLNHWRNLNGPSLSAAYRSFAEEWEDIYFDQPAMLAALPHYDAVRRTMSKLPKREKSRGRVSGSAAKALETYQKRDWSLMPVNGCWICDSKSMNLKVQHPQHGRPFTPELTLVIDGRTRYPVGWSLAKSENVIAVADAYRHAMQHHGKPLFVYSDNGGGEKNKTLDADITGIFPRLGITHMTGIPGNPQARGIIERQNAVIPLRIAQRFQTFNGTGADQEHVRMTSRAIMSAVKAVESQRDLTPLQKKSLAKLPTWQQLLDAIEYEVNKYNQEHRHSELPKRNGVHMTAAEYRRELLESEGDEIEYLTDIELREMFMPEDIRIAQRGWIELENNQYFSEALIQVDGESVRVASDIHDASKVIIRRMDGSYVCTAIWNGNKQAAIPVNKMDIAVEKRRQRRLKRNEEQRREIEAEALSVLDVSIMPDFGSFIPVQQPDDGEEYHFLEVERNEFLKKSETSR